MRRASSSVMWVVCGLLSCSLAAGCGGEKVAHPPAAQGFEAADRHQPDEVVAKVAGRTIGLDELEHFLSEHPGLDREQALERLIERELLVDEALERDLHAEPAMQLERKRAMVRELLRQSVEEEITEDQITDEELAKAVEQVRREVGHPPGVRASHLVVLVPPDKQKEASKEQVEKWFAQSRTWLDTMRADIPKEPTVLDLLEVRDAYQDKLPEPLEATVNAHMLFPVEDTDKYGGDLPETWHTVVPKFRDAAKALAEKGRLGELSEPVKTQFGWHVIVAEETLLAKVADEEQVREVARWRLLRQKRNKRFAELMQKWAADADIQTFPRVISEAEELNN